MFRVGLIGLGIISKSHLDAYSKLDMAEVVAVSDISSSNYTDEMKQHGIRFYSDYREMILNEKLDISVLRELKAKADIFGKTKNRTFYALFSKSGFTEAVINEARTDDSIILADLNEIMNF